MLTLEVRESSEIMMLRCAGRVCRGDGADTLLRAVMAGGKRQIQLDLSGVTAIDAHGLGVLAALERRALEQGRTLHILNPSSRVREALETTGLSSVLQVRPLDQDLNGDAA